MAPHTYTQPIKDESRRRLLTQAVRALTKDRSKSTIVRAEEFWTTLNHAKRTLLGHGFAPHTLAEIDSIAEDWLAYFSEVTGSRTASELKVLYLCGPEPLNDLNLLLALGIRPQNVWAVESHKKSYSQAVKQLRESCGFIHLHQGNLSDLFEQVGDRFDIVYVDACSHFPMGRPSTVLPLLHLFKHERLAPLGALVCNFSELPRLGEHKKASVYHELLSLYLAPRSNDFPSGLALEDGQEPDPAEVRTDPMALLPYIRANPERAYSEFITRFIVDLGRHIVPHCRVGANPDLSGRYFSEENDTKKAVKKAMRKAQLSPGQVASVENVLALTEKMGDVRLAPSSYPVLSFLQWVIESESLKEPLQAMLSFEFRQKKPGVNFRRITLQEAFPPSVLLEQIIEGHIGAASKEMKEALRASWFDIGSPMFCDTPLPNLMINSLFGIYSHPYHLNPRPTLRLTYQAKTQRMFSDCLILDQCRYYYDYLPAIELIPARWKSIAFQLVARVFLDRMSWHDHNSSSHPMSGAALAGMGTKAAAEPYELEDRERLGHLATDL